MNFPLLVGVLCLSLFCYALLCVHSSFAIISKGKRKLVALLLFSYRCIVDFSLTVKAATLIFIPGCGSAIPSALEGKSGFIYNLVKS